MIKIHRPPCPHPEALAHGNYKHRRNITALRQANFDKCMYCESKISHVDFAEIEHIKPKANDKYPELTYDWGNLGYVCSVCNNLKGDKYVETNPYVDPYSEDPRVQIVAVGAYLFARDGSERGEITILDIGLDRGTLIEKRQTRIETIVKAITACYRTRDVELRRHALDELKKEMLPEKEYSLIMESVMRLYRIIT